jgi:hypothetical protein
MKRANANMTRTFGGIVLVVLIVFVAFVHGAPTSPGKTPSPEPMKIRLKVDDRVMTATLSDSKTARDFISLLPLTLNVNIK